MPKSFLQSIIFTLIMAPIMVYVMGVYNLALAHRVLENKTFIQALEYFPVDLMIAFPIALLFAGRIAPKLAFRIVKPEDREIFKIWMVTVFVVCIMVPSMSLIAILRIFGFNDNFIPRLLTAICFNFIMAMPLQLIVIGPLVRFLFKRVMQFGKAAKQTLERLKRSPDNTGGYIEV